MSAFYDLWISETAKPVHTRITNNAWSCDCGFDNIYTSKPLAPSLHFVPYVKHATSDYYLIVLGQFYEEIDLNQLILDCHNHIYHKQNFKDPAGHYILILRHNTQNTTHVFTNRLGSYHAYWSNSSGQNIISTYYLGLAKHSHHSKELNWEGLSSFFAMGYFPGQHTYLKDINIFLPASCYSFDASLNLIDSHRYWDWHYEPSGISTPQAIAQLNEILKASLHYSTRNKTTAIPISGGLDSRMLAGIVSNQRSAYNNLWSFSYGYNSTSNEIRIAKQVAAACNIPFESFVVPNYLFEKLELITDSVELFQYVDGTRQAMMSDILPAKAELVLGGHWGDVWMDNINTNSGKTHALDTFLNNKLIKRGSSWLLENVCGSHLTKPSDSVAGFFYDGIKRFEHIKDLNFMLKAYKTDTWSFRWTLASIRMYQAGAFPVLPFYDNRIVELFTKLPTSLTEGRQLQIEFIKTVQPALATITWQKYDRDLYNYKNSKTHTLAYRVTHKLKRVLTGNRGITRNWEVFYLNKKGKEQLKLHLLNTSLTDFVSSKKIVLLIDELYKNPTAANGYSVSMLLTFSRFLNQVFI